MSNNINIIIYILMSLSHIIIIYCYSISIVYCTKKIRFSRTTKYTMGNEVCSLLNELNVIKDRDDIRQAKLGVRKIRQQLHGAAREECIPFSLVTEDQLNFLLRVLESAEGRAKMRMLLRGVIEEREVLVSSIEDMMYRDMEGEDEYDPISVRAEDSPVSRLHLIKTVSSNKELTESLALQFPNLYEGRKYYKSHHKMESKRTSPLPLVKKKKTPSPKKRTTRKKKKNSSPKQKVMRKKSLKNQQKKKEKEKKKENTKQPLGTHSPNHSNLIKKPQKTNSKPQV